MCAIVWNGGAATPPRMCWTSARRGVVVALLYVATGAPPKSATAVTTAPADALMLTGLRWRSRGCLATRPEGFRRLRWRAWWWLLALRSVPARWRSCCLRRCGGAGRCGSRVAGCGGRRAVSAGQRFGVGSGAGRGAWRIQVRVVAAVDQLEQPYRQRLERIGLAGAASGAAGTAGVAGAAIRAAGAGLYLAADQLEQVGQAAVEVEIRQLYGWQAAGVRGCIRWCTGTVGRLCAALYWRCSGIGGRCVRRRGIGRIGAVAALAGADFEFIVVLDFDFKVEGAPIGGCDRALADEMRAVAQAGSRAAAAAGTGALLCRLGKRGGGVQADRVERDGFALAGVAEGLLAKAAEQVLRVIDGRAAQRRGAVLQNAVVRQRHRTAAGGAAGRRGGLAAAGLAVLLGGRSGEGRGLQRAGAEGGQCRHGDFR